MRRALVLAAVALSLSGGCRRSVDRFGGRAFYQGDGHYRIRYEPDRLHRLLPAPWQPQNFTPTGRGPRVDRNSRWATVVELTGPTYQRPYRLRRSRVDVLLMHGPTGSLAWAKTILPEAHWPRQTDVPTIVRSVERGIAVGGRLGPLVPEEASPDPTAELSVVDRGAVIVDGRPGRYLTYDARRSTGDVSRGTVVVMDVGAVAVHRDAVFPVIHVFGIATPRAEHDRGLRELRSLVSRVDFAPPP